MGQIVFAGGNNVTLSQSISASSATITISGARGIILVSNSLVVASTQVLSFTGANVTDHVYTFHIYISNPLVANPIYSVMFNGISAGITRRYFIAASSGNVTATSDVNAYAFNLDTNQEAHHVINMMFHTSPVRMQGTGNEENYDINQQIIRQTGTAATNVTAIVISANVANAIGPNSRIIWYKQA